MSESDERRLASVALHASDIQTLREFVRDHPFDFGCHPRSHEHERRGFVMGALLTEHEIGVAHEHGLDVEVLYSDVPSEIAADTTVSKIDRFEDGAIAPQGLGSQNNGEGGTHVPGGIMNPTEIGTAVKGLVNTYGIPTVTPPNATSGGEHPPGGAVPADIDPEAYHVLFTAGMHARERGGPDGLVYFIADLLYARDHGSGLGYGNRHYSNADVHKALNTGIVFYPLVNPDGVAYDQATDSLWRKNRNPASATAGDPYSIGVDINRNFNFLWDFKTHFAPGAWADSLASDRPSSNQFHGPHPFSEPETSNIAWIYDQFARLRWFMDIHSADGTVLYSWGSDSDQTSDGGMTFTNPAWDRKRGLLGPDDDNGYEEFIDGTDLERIRSSATRVTGAMHAVDGRPYQAEQSCALYPTSGASDDYAFSRTFADASHNKTYGFTMEFGPPGPPYRFYPTLEEFDENTLDIGAGLMEFCLAAADLGLT